MTRKLEGVAALGINARIVATDDYMSFDIDYLSEGGERKTLRLAHSDAWQIMAAIEGAFRSMTVEERARSYRASISRDR